MPTSSGDSIYQVPYATSAAALPMNDPSKNAPATYAASATEHCAVSANAPARDSPSALCDVRYLSSRPSLQSDCWAQACGPQSKGCDADRQAQCVTAALVRAVASPAPAVPAAVMSPSVPPIGEGSMMTNVI